MVPNVFVMSVKKLIKYFAEKSCSVLRGVNGTPPNTLKLFWLNVLFVFVTNHEKYK